MCERIETYDQAIEFLYCRLNYERAVSMPYTRDELKLARMHELLDRLGNPHQGMRIVHVAGTKGKGSTSAMLASILSAAGYRTGLFTSPHLYGVEERLAIDGRAASRDDVVAILRRIQPHIEAMEHSTNAHRTEPTYFELTTAMALDHFRRSAVDWAVLEVGMGGRLDATNVCRPAVSVITSISRDHTKQLGTTLEQIAAEKAGIVKPGVPVVSGATAPAARRTIAEICRERHAGIRELERDFRYEYTPPIFTHGSASRAAYMTGAPTGGALSVTTWRGHRRELSLPLLGCHQAANAAVALAVADTLADQGHRIPGEAIARGLAAVRWPARIEVVGEQPTVIVDGAHNYAAVAALLETIETCFPATRRLLVFATTREKDIRGMLAQLLPRFDRVIVTRYENNPRGVPPGEVAQIAAQLADTPLVLCATPADAWREACRLATPSELVCITGSFFIAAEIRALVVGERRRPAALRVSPAYVRTDSG